MTLATYEYAAAIYTDGSVDASIVEEPFHNDVLVTNALALTSDSQGLGLRFRSITAVQEQLTSIYTNNILNSTHAFQNLAHHAEILPIIPELDEQLPRSPVSSTGPGSGAPASATRVAPVSQLGIPE